MPHGYIFAALAAALYGTNPAFAVPLYKMGLNPISVILWRYLLGVPFMAVCMIYRHEGLGLNREAIFPITALGILMAVSSLTLYEAYNFMNPGVASTLLFMYPILTALIMTIFFHEKFRPLTAVCLCVMSAGLYLLTISSEGVSLSFIGLALIAVSSLTYAIYLVMVRVSRAVRLVPTFKSLFYQLLAGAALYLLIGLTGRNLMPPPGLRGWMLACCLALFPTVLSLICTIRAIGSIGPTPTAIFGALEPVTAVILSIIFLGESITLRELAGAMLIIVATMLVVVGPSRH